MSKSYILVKTALMLLNDEDENVRENIAESLRYYAGNSDVISGLKIVAKNDESDSVRLIALRSLVQLISCDNSIKLPTE